VCQIEHPSDMPVDVQTEIVIDRPLPEVADFSANPDNVPTWYVNINSVEWKTEPPLRIGSCVAFVAQFLGRRLAYTYEIIDYLPHELLIMRTAEGPFPMETTYRWEAIQPTKTRMRLRNRGSPTGFSRLMSVLMVPAIRRANTKDLARLKSLLESL
jgi:uncharacterized membrane protein